MRMVHMCLIVTAIGSLPGCATQPKPSVVNQVVPVRAQDFILVSSPRLGSYRVAIPPGGTTLRSALASARDEFSHGGTLALAQSLNNVNEFNQVTGANLAFDSHTAESQPVNAINEWIAIVRGGTWMIAPAALVDQTSYGSVRVTSSDVMIVLPLQAIEAAFTGRQRDIDGGENETTLDDNFKSGSYALTFEVDREVRSLDGPQSAAIVMDNIAGTDTGVRIRSSTERRPNVMIIERTMNNSRYQIILPAVLPNVGFPSQGQTAPGTVVELIAEAYAPTFSGNIWIRNGDVIEFTRLEQLPIVAVGLILPVPSRTVSQVVTGATQRHQAICPDHSISGSCKLIPSTNYFAP